MATDEERKTVKLYVDKVLANSKAMREQYALLYCKTDNLTSLNELKNPSEENANIQQLLL